MSNPLPSRESVALDLALAQVDLSDVPLRDILTVAQHWASGRLVDREEDIDIEAVAAVEHDQWVLWAKAVAHEVEPDRAVRWRTFYVPYSELPEATKDSNRVWARRAVDAALGEE